MQKLLLLSPTLVSSNANILKQTVNRLKSNVDIFKRSDWPTVGGPWLQIPSINLGARYKPGASNLLDIDKQQKWKSQAFTFFAGFTF